MYVLIGAGIVFSAIIGGSIMRCSKKSEEETNENLPKPKKKIKITLEELSNEDPIEFFQKRRDLFLVAYSSHLENTGRSEGAKELLKLCSEKDIKKLKDYIDLIEDDPEAGLKHSRLYILLGKSRTAYLEKSLTVEEEGHEEEILEEIKIMNDIDNIILRYGLI